jgi:hypothetical protein
MKIISLEYLCKACFMEKKGCRSFIEKNPASTVPRKRTIHRTVGKIFIDRVGSS